MKTRKQKFIEMSGDDLEKLYEFYKDSKDKDVFLSSSRGYNILVKKVI